MSVNQIIMYIMAFGAALGGIDQMLGNKLGYGEKFEDGFRMLGPVALAMAGIICLAPALSSVLGFLVNPLCSLLHVDPGIFGSILAIDMGGCELSMELARNPEFGRFSGIILSSIFGCTVVFSIPVGLSFLQNEDQTYFTRGILLGLATLPASIIIAARMLRLPLLYILWNCLPVMLISLLLAIGVLKKPDVMNKGFQRFSEFIKIVAILGLTLAAVTHLTGIPLLQNLLPLEDAMNIVSSICIVMLGSMPLAELIQRLLKKPFEKIGARTGLNGATTTGILLGLISATPALAMVPKMNPRGQVVASACLVSSICSFGAHFAYADSVCPEMVPALLAAKLLGGLMALLLAMAATKDLILFSN